MSGNEFKATIRRLGLNQAEVSRALGTHESTISRICNGLKPTDRMVARLLAIDPAKYRGKVRRGRPRAR
jgi:transcriptional regulator with XRE-family HTH domain